MRHLLAKSFYLALIVVHSVGKLATFRQALIRNHNEESRHIRSTGSAVSEVQDLILTSVSATTVTLEWKPPENVDGIIVGYNVSIEVRYLLGCAKSNRPTPEQEQPRPQFVNQTKASFEGLHPHAWYMATVVAHTASEKGSPKMFPFRTNEAHIPTSIIHNFRIEERGTILRWDWPDDCTTVTGVAYYTKLKFQSANDIIKNSTLEYTTLYRSFTLSELYLIPGVKYTIRAYVARNDAATVNLDKYASLTWTIPRGVTELEAYDTDCEKNTTSLRFIPPILFDDQIKSYSASITEENKPPKDVTYINSAKLNCDLWDNRTCLEDLYLPSNAALDIKIHATGKKDNGFETSSNITFSLEESCKTNLSWQVNFTLTKNCGLVKLRWKKPLPIPTKITRFVIRVDPLDRHQLDNSTLEFPIIEEIHAGSKQNEYTTEFSLPEGRTYIISLVAFDQWNISSMKNAVQLPIPKKCASEDQVAVPPQPSWKKYLPYLTILPIITILLLLIFVRYRKKKEVSSPDNYSEYIVPQSGEMTRTNTSTTFHRLGESAAQSDISEEEEGMHEYAVPNEPLSNYISVPHFQEYAKDAVISGLLHSEFEKLPRGTTKRCEYGKVPENMPKNRCVKQIPYDETRVILNRILGDPYSDYINASHIQGYGKRAYIAAQGPMPNTVDDFWRMIWQKNVRVICMLTNVVEDDKTMCEQYWPDVRTTTEYGDVVVANVEHQVYANYTFRTFHLNYGTITRKVMHLHYTGWPSQGVPKDPQSLVEYLEKLIKTPVGDGPVLIHCSTGDGRTGVVTLCDICIREAAIANVIDVAGVTHRMRKSRAMMVSTQQQYNLAHVVIAKSVSEPSTSVECNEHLLQSVDEMRKRLPTDIKRLDDTEWHEQALFSGDAYQPPNSNESTEENRNGNHSGLYLELKNPCNYTNAVSVDGLSMKREYLASPLPSPTTLSEFWRFVIGDGVKLVIVLQPADPKNSIQCDIIPSKMTVGFAPDIQVETKTRFFDESYVKHELLVTDTSAKGARPHALTIFTCVGWEGDKNGKRPAPATLLTIWRTSENIQRDKGQTLVLCRDGITGCGLYLAMSSLLERMAAERVCDVISAVRAVRRSGPEFVRSHEEFEYLYDVALAYAKYFECYANFT